jgi:peroxiredoxin
MLSNTTHAIGWKARDFALPAIDGKTYSLAEVRGPKGTLVVFVCNHCPYVKASIKRTLGEVALAEGALVDDAIVGCADSTSLSARWRLAKLRACS